MDAVLTRDKPLLKLREGDCRWPLDGQGAAMRFCARPVDGARSYCAEHCRRAGAGFTYRGLGKFTDFKGGF